MNRVENIPVLGFCAYSGTGKTTLLVKLLPVLKGSGLRVAMIKHAHHDFDIDKPGKDSYELRKAGADQVLIASDKRLALMQEIETEQDLPSLIARLDLGSIDLVLVEGFRHVAFPKIELHRPSLGKELIFPHDEDVIAVASDEEVDSGDIPCLSLNDTGEIAAFIKGWVLRRNEKTS